MIIKQYSKITTIALLMWGAMLVFACKSSEKSEKKDEVQKIMETDNPVMTSYENGRTLYKMIAPHLERYQGKDTVYIVFDKGIYIESYDSLGNIESWIKAKYAINYESVGRWEARDSVVGQDKEGKRIYTDTLFWDQKKKMITSPSKTRVVDGEESVIGYNGFESDEALKNILFYNSKGRITVDTTKNEAETLVEPTDSVV